MAKKGSEEFRTMQVHIDIDADIQLGIFAKELGTTKRDLAISLLEGAIRSKITEWRRGREELIEGASEVQLGWNTLSRLIKVNAEDYETAIRQLLKMHEDAERAKEEAKSEERQERTQEARDKERIASAVRSLRSLLNEHKEQDSQIRAILDDRVALVRRAQTMLKRVSTPHVMEPGEETDDENP